MLWSLLMSANLDPELRVPSLTCILGTVPVLIAELIKMDLVYAIYPLAHNLLVKVHTLAPYRFKRIEDVNFTNPGAQISIT